MLTKKNLPASGSSTPPAIKKELNYTVPFINLKKYFWIDLAAFFRGFLRNTKLFID